jgi:TonB-linked SusC/RagA family outer membrane protein
MKKKSVFVPAFRDYYLKKLCLMMRLMLFLIFVSMFVATANTASSQSEKLSMTFENASLTEVFEKMEDQLKIGFLLPAELLKDQQKINMSVKNSTIEGILHQILDSKGYEFEFVGKNVVVTKGLSSQQKNISGKVTDSSGTPLPGVTIVVKGSTTGIITDFEGKYTLPNVPGDATLVFSFVGMKTQEMKVTGKTTIDVMMEEETVGIEEVVAIGYGTQKKETLTGAISAISSNDIQRSQATTTSGSLVGKIQGINTRMTDGRPGASTTIQIRNMGTPLYVIDGVQKDQGQFNNLDFNDIESISVLKDASAAIYGVKAANGVVVVTTKKGSRNTKNHVNVNASYGWQSMFRFPKPADAATYVASYIQSDVIQRTKNPKYSMDDLEKWQEGTEKGYRPFDWYDYVLRTSPQTYIAVNSSGGSDKINYYMAVSHLDQKANILNYGGFFRTNVQFNVEANITNKLKVGADMNGRLEKRKHPGVPGSDDTWRALFAIYRNLPTKRPFANDNPNYPALTSSGGSENFGMLNYETAGYFKDLWRVMQLNFNAEYEILDGLKVKGLFSYYFAHRWADNQEYTYDLYDYDDDTDTYSVVYSMTNPYRNRTIANVEETMGQGQISYKKQLGKHSIDAMVAAESYQRKSPNIYVHSRPESNSISLINFEVLDKYNDNGDETEARLGYIGRFDYNYDQKYLFDFSARYDGSWKFPKGDRWGFFPSASIGWRISEENFWKKIPVSNILNNLKVRASYGLLGDDNISGYDDFDYLNGYDYDKGGAVLNGEYVIGACPRDLAVTSISWIKAKLLNVGIDFGLFSNKLTGSFDYFVRKRTGLPDERYDVLIPSEAGFSLPPENLDSDKTKGMDAIIKWKDKIGDVGYSVGANLTYARKYNWHEYKPRYGNSWDEYRNSSTERYASVRWMYHCIGQFQSWEEIANYPVDIDGDGNTTLRPGDLIYQDENGDNVINSMDQRPHGYPSGTTPIFNFGINMACNWKGIDLALDFAGAAGYSYTYTNESKLPFRGGGNNPQYMMSNQWHLSDLGDPDSELIPGKYPTLLVGNNGHSNYWSSDFWTVNGRYLKLKNLEIGYTFPSRWVNKAGMSKFRVSVSGQNLFSLDNFNEIDPEITRGDGLNYPTNRVFSIGVNIEL